MLFALKTKKVQFIAQTLRQDWRLRFSSIRECREILNEMSELTKSNDHSFVRLSIEILGHIIGFEASGRIQQSELTQMREIYEQITQMLLLFVRSNEQEKNIILDSVFLIRKIVQLFPSEQFQLIQKIAAQNDRSITLLIAIMALVPYLLAFNLLNNTNQDQYIVQFTQQIMQKLNVSDWLSPLTNGYLGFYDAGFQIQLLDTNKFFDNELNNYLKKITAESLPQFISTKKLVVEDDNFYITKSQIFAKLQQNKQLSPFNQLLPQLKSLADQGNIEALQVLTAVSTIDLDQTHYLITYLNNTLTRPLSPTYYESLFEIIAYYFQKLQLSDQQSILNSKNFVEFVKFFQNLLKNDQLNNATFQTQIHIARILGMLGKLRKYLIVSSQFLKEIIIYLTQCVQAVLLSKESSAFSKIVTQLKQNEGLAQIQAVQAWQPPPCPSKNIRVLLMQVLYALQILIEEKDIDVLEFIEQLIQLIFEYRVCANISVFRFLCGDLVIQLQQRLFGVYSVFDQKMPFQQCADMNLKQLISNLLKMSIQDPQWRNRLQIYHFYQQMPQFLFQHLVEDFEFPFLNMNHPGADTALVLGDQRFEISFFSQVVDPVWQVRSCSYKFLQLLYYKTFNTPMEMWTTDAQKLTQCEHKYISYFKNYEAQSKKLLKKPTDQQLKQSKLLIPKLNQQEKYKISNSQLELIYGVNNKIEISEQLIAQMVQAINQNKQNFAKHFAEFKQDYIITVQDEQGCDVSNSIQLLESILQVLFSILSILQFAEVKYLKESFLHISYFCLNVLQNIAFVREQQLPQCSDVGRRLHLQEKDRALQDYEKVLGCLRGVGW